ncbi:MAG: class I SAM-dependent methyltransferase [Elusimicrobia bacterium]|nr:class I SAM-dependent methyltransferase [Elusimicrobiota bacterium]
MKTCVADLEDFFDKNVERYLDGCYGGKQRYPSNAVRKSIMLHYVDKYFKSRKRKVRILDAGCGAGNLMVELLDRGYKVEGMDVSASMLEHCRRALSARGYSPELVQKGDVFALSKLVRSQYDLVLCAGLLGYLPRHDLVFAQIRKVLKPDGLVITDIINRLFDLFTFNKHTVDFLDRLFQEQGLPTAVRRSVTRTLGRRLEIGKEYELKKSFKGEEIESSEVDVDYNSLNYARRFAQAGFRLRDVWYYHRHPIPTIFERSFPKLFQHSGPIPRGLPRNEWYDALLCNTSVVVLERDKR